MPRTDENCEICQNEDLRLIVDGQLFAGHDKKEIAAELGREPEFANLVWYHYTNQHVRPCTRDNYTAMLITYMHDVRAVERRELQKSSERQRPSTLDRCDKGKRWALDTIAKFEGFFDHKQKRLPGEAQKLLEAVAAQQPEIIARIQRNQEPVEVTATETPQR